MSIERILVTGGAVVSIVAALALIWLAWWFMSDRAPMRIDREDDVARNLPRKKVAK